MGTATLTPDAVLRTAKFTRGDQEVEHPVDVFGRAVSFTTLRANPITRADDDTAPIGFKGEAIVFNQRTWIGSRNYGYWEQIAPEAVTKTLQEADIRFLINHDPNLLLARNGAAGSLRLSASATALDVDADMRPTTVARDLALLLEGGEMSQMSFAFTPLAWRTEEADDGKELITFTEIRLWDVSVVTYPAYEMTTAGLRSEAFDALCRAQSLDPTEVLRSYASGAEIAPPAPAETTRTDEHGEPPAETTAPEPRTDLSAAHLARRTQLVQEAMR